MDAPQRVTLNDASELLKQDFDEFSRWYRHMVSVAPDQFPTAMPPVQWLMAMRGWSHLAHVPDGPLAAICIPSDAQSWYDLNLTTRPFLVTIGEVVTILLLGGFRNEAYEFIRRIRDLIAWPEGRDWDDGSMFHIAQDYIRPTSALDELLEE